MSKLLLLSAAIFVSSDIDYAQVWKQDHKQAIQFLETHQSALQSMASEYEADPAIIQSVVFPELIRHSIFRDFFETKALELVYTQHGSEYADFSIGSFQMKPSFIEAMEASVKADCELSEKYSQVVQFAGSNTEAIREERLQRLQDLDWQIRYLCCFYSLVEKRFPHFAQLSKQDQVRFYATAYNAGYQKDEVYLKKAAAYKFFPYGSNFPGQQYSYSDIAADYFQRYYPRLQTTTSRTSIGTP